MRYAVQPSLLEDDPDQPTTAAPAQPVRRELSDGAWVDFAPGWCDRPDELLARLLEVVPWRAERRQMYDRVVDVPRLVAHCEGPDLPDAHLSALRERLNERYAPALGEPLVSAGLCLYRDGRDSVAWHGDTIGRGRYEDTIVAIVSLGSARTLTLRPRSNSPGRQSLRYPVGHGDLFVMGGSCQRTWEHAVPKTTAAVGPRVSIQFRPAGVR